MRSNCIGIIVSLIAKSKLKSLFKITNVRMICQLWTHLVRTVVGTKIYQKSVASLILLVTNARDMVTVSALETSLQKRLAAHANHKRFNISFAVISLNFKTIIQLVRS